jgi:hypothetical protein
MVHHLRRRPLARARCRTCLLTQRLGLRQQLVGSTFELLKTQVQTIIHSKIQQV